MELNFQFIPFLEGARGIGRFFLKEVRPHFKLYLSPVNIDPSSPVMPISSPESFSEELSREIGLFYTQGIPEDTDALSGGVLNAEEFLRQSRIVFEEELKMLDYALERFQSGFSSFTLGEWTRLDIFSGIRLSLRRLNKLIVKWTRFWLRLLQGGRTNHFNGSLRPRFCTLRSILRLELLAQA